MQNKNLHKSSLGERLINKQIIFETEWVQICKDSVTKEVS